MRVLQGRRAQRRRCCCTGRSSSPRRTLGCVGGYPVTLLVAPAGYGKSVVLRQYLAGLREPYVRFALRSEHATLLSFLRGFAEALSDRAPHAITALAGAYERTTSSAKRSNELARWMHAHLESFRGVIAIDDLHAANDDPEVARIPVVPDRTNERRDSLDSRVARDKQSTSRHVARVPRRGPADRRGRFALYARRSALGRRRLWAWPSATTSSTNCSH